jgi:hypothetical protein
MNSEIGEQVIIKHIKPMSHFGASCIFAFPSHFRLYRRENEPSIGFEIFVRKYNTRQKTFRVGASGRRISLDRRSLCAWVVVVVLVLATIAFPLLHGRAHPSMEVSRIRNPTYDGRCPGSHMPTIENCQGPQTSQEPENRASRFSDLHAPD